MVVKMDIDSHFHSKVYRIPFRPEYLLIEGENSGAFPYNMVSTASPTNRDIKAFRFHLTPEAIALIAQQDPEVTQSSGFCSVTIRFDAGDPGTAMMEVERGIVNDWAKARL